MTPKEKAKALMEEFDRLYAWTDIIPLESAVVYSVKRRQDAKSKKDADYWAEVKRILKQFY